MRGVAAICAALAVTTAAAVAASGAPAASSAAPATPFTMYLRQVTAIDATYVRLEKRFGKAFPPASGTSYIDLGGDADELEDVAREFRRLSVATSRIRPPVPLKVPHARYRVGMIDYGRALDLLAPAYRDAYDVGSADGIIAAAGPAGIKVRRSKAARKAWRTALRAQTRARGIQVPLWLIE